VLAEILRTDRAADRSLPQDSKEARALEVLCRTQQDTVWDAFLQLTPWLLRSE
jgi:hypothetical protein